MPGEIEEVLLLRHASEEDVAAVEAAFAAAGFEVRARAEVELRGGGIGSWGGASLPWDVYVVLGVPLALFLQGFMSAAGEDAYDAVKRWVRDIVAAHDRPGYYRNGAIDVRDSAGGGIVFSAGLSDEAFAALRLLDWSAVEGDLLLWDADTGRWYDRMRLS